MKNHQKVSDFHFRTAPDHGKEALWPRTQQFVDFGAKIVRIVPKSARMNAFLVPIASLQARKQGPKSVQKYEIREFCGKSSMGTLEKSSESHEFGTVRKRFAKNRDFHFWTAPDHIKEALWHRTRKFVYFGAKNHPDRPQIRKNERVLVPIASLQARKQGPKVCKIMKSANFAENHRWGP